MGLIRPIPSSPKREPVGTVTATEAIVRQHGRRPSNAATGGGRPLLLPDAYTGHGSRHCCWSIRPAVRGHL
ncbi:MAG: hypothetical protein WAN22_29360, partial [Solirubrobacteraceae bacterium]